MFASSYYVCFDDRYAHDVSRLPSCPKCGQAMTHYYGGALPNRDDHKAWRSIQDPTTSVRRRHVRTRIAGRLAQRRRQPNPLAEWERELLSNI